MSKIGFKTKEQRRQERLPVLRSEAEPTAQFTEEFYLKADAILGLIAFIDKLMQEHAHSHYSELPFSQRHESTIKQKLDKFYIKFYEHVA